MRDRDRLAALAVLIALALSVGGCLLSSEEQTSVSGRYVAQETLNKVEVGVDEQFVLDLLGEPKTRSESKAGTEIWAWEYTKATTSKGAVFLLIAHTKTTRESDTIFVELKHGKVTKTWRSSD